MFRAIFFLIAMRLPGGFRRSLLKRTLGYDIDPTATVGLSLVSVGYLRMDEHAWIGTATVIKGLDRLVMEEHAQIGRLDWISGLPTGSDKFFAHLPDRDPSLIMKRHSTITHRHMIDCSDRITFNPFSGIGGYHCTFLTHSVDLHENRQSAAPIEVGEYTFVATNCVVLGGSRLPAYSALAAGSVMRGSPEESGLYSGVPAKFISKLPEDAKFFKRQHGRIG